MSEQDKISELVDIIDKLMSDGGGHVNIIADENNDDGDITVQTYICTDCGCNNKKAMACNEPTLHEGIDETEDNY